MQQAYTLTRFSEVAPQLVTNGYTVVPAIPGTKRPAVRGWAQLSVDDLSPERIAQLSAMFPRAGVFCACGRVVGIDNDFEDADLNRAVEKLRVLHLGETPTVRFGNEPRSMAIYRTREPIRTMRLNGFEVRAHGAGIMLYGVHPKTGRPYRYAGATPLDVAVNDLPPISPQSVDALFDAVATLTGEHRNPLLGANVQSTATTELMMDGRERFVSGQIWQLYCAGWRDCEAITLEVFGRLSRLADLTRPHSSGAIYNPVFVRSRVLGTLRSAKPIFVKSPRPAAEGRPLTQADRTAFRNAVNAAGALGKLRRASVIVSHAMLGSIGVANSAYVSTQTLAHRTGLAVDTVKRARRELRDMGFWVAVGDAGGRAKIAHYLPVLDLDGGENE